MANKKFKLVYFGEIAEGNEITSVKKNIGQLLKVDEAKVERFFTAESVTIKKDIDYETAFKYKAIFEKTGGKCTIVPMDDIPQETSAETRPNVKVKPTESVGRANATFPKDKSVVIEEHLKQQKVINELHNIEQDNDDKIYPEHLGIKESVFKRKRFTYSAYVISILLIIVAGIYWSKFGVVKFRNNAASGSNKVPTKVVTEAVRVAGHSNTANEAQSKDEFVYEMPSDVMMNTISKYDKLTIKKNTIYEQNYVVAYRYKDIPNQIFIGRIIGVPGDTIQIINKIVHINNNKFSDQYGITNDKNIIPADANPRDNYGPKTLSDNEFFVLGDNRDSSYDSRFMRPLRKEEIVGKVIKIEAIKSDKPTP